MKQPNILYIIPDEFRQRALGFRGEDPVHTPNIDALAAESTELEHVFSNYPVCTPHRGMLFTGQYACNARVMGNSNSATSQFHVRLPKNRTCLSDVLHESGYYCGYVGKWHLDSPEPADFEFLENRRSDGKVWDAFTPVARRHNFEYWFSYGCNDKHFRPHYWDNTDKVEEVTQFEGRWSPEVEAEKVVAFLRNEEGQRPENQPFFLFWAPNPPHMPFEEVPQRYKDIYKDSKPEDLLNAVSYREVTDVPEELPVDLAKDFEANRALALEEVQNYFAGISGIDDYIGQVLQTLDELGLKEDTLVVFASDHGDLMGSHGLIRKGPWFDECLKIPFLLRWPGHLEPGRREQFLMNTPDIMPTLLGLLGLKEKIPKHTEGFDLSRFIKDSACRPETGAEAGILAYYMNAQLQARGVRDNEYFMVVLFNRHDEETWILYDLKKDPHMLKNVAQDNQEVCVRYREKLQNWMERCQDWCLF